mmetsp:Transcript_25687/g.54259  ORF Transcript_25687/g.54259 Transcript_25687/m.54259 type:complete len:579 (+) Transcript_25687:93-1829(+)
MEAAAFSCPICLASSAEDRAVEPKVEPVDPSVSAPAASTDQHDGAGVTFVKTPCGHTFCVVCIERVLLKPRDGILTRAPCPMCRETVNLFDLTHATKKSLVYDAATDISSWSVTGCQYRQSSLAPSPGPDYGADLLLQAAIDLGGAIEGHGIHFSFQESSASMKFERPLKVTSHGNWTEDADNLQTLDSITFDRTCFHEKSMTFCGKSSFANPICDSKRIDCEIGESYFFDKVDCLLQFSGNGHYIRRGNLRWALVSTSTETYPLDGVWEVRFTRREAMTEIIHVQKHFFTSISEFFHITIDPDHHPRFMTRGGSDNLRCNQHILPGTNGPDIGDTLEWEHAKLGIVAVWKRRAMNLDDCWLSYDIKIDNFVYRRCNGRASNNPSLGPSYHADTLWGNTFCQLYTVGLASYHFLEPDSEGNYQAYISYEHPKTEMWPPLDNGETVPSRVQFRNISWDASTRVFKGDICWEQDFGTSWMNETKWSYEILFDPTFKFIVSGTVLRSMDKDPNKFGLDLIYINAALESPLRTSLATLTTGGYVDVMRQWRDSSASSETLQMLGNVAIALMDQRESLFDFNL